MYVGAGYQMFVTMRVIAHSHIGGSVGILLKSLEFRLTKCTSEAFLRPFWLFYSDCILLSLYMHYIVQGVGLAPTHLI